jgi:heme/copper-type cytochrome/quinol oxidase subunit 3
MVPSVLFTCVMSMIVWAHHMFLTGMGTTLGTFFQITTMIISIPSVVLITSLMLSLWGGAIRFAVPMQFALAFLPMFGIGGLSGLPLGLAASDVMLHDTWYVVGHFHFLVAPGTVFAIFAGIYYWFPTVTGRSLSHRLGVLHFWGSFVTMTAIFLPMFTLGLRGVNRRLYDAGQQYALAQGTLGIQEHMTWAALALGIAQLPFVLNLIITLRGDRARAESTSAPVVPVAIDARVRQGASTDAPGVEGSHTALPWTFTPRPDTRVTNVRIGIWLFLASEAMFFGSLFSAYVLLRTGSSSWPPATWMPWPQTMVLTVLLAITTTCLHIPRWRWPGTVPMPGDSPQYVNADTAYRWRLAVGAAGLAALAFLIIKSVDYVTMIRSGLHPANHLALASWFVLTGVHGIHVLGGIVANAWLTRSITGVPAVHVAERMHAVRLYWAFVDCVWIAILVSFLL